MPETAHQNHGLVSVLVGFGRALREEDLAVGSGDVISYCEAMTSLDPTDLADLYWCGRTCMITRHKDVEIYNEVFRAYFMGAESPFQELLQIKSEATAEAEAAFDIPAGDSREEQDSDDEENMGLMASNVETLKRKSFVECTPEELAQLRRIMQRFELRPPKRRTRRTRVADRGRRLDIRRTIRGAMRTQGEIISLCRRERRIRRRPLVLILDVSGSMTEYSRGLLQFAYGAKRSADKVEVFCFGTRLTCVTDSLERRTPDIALEEAANLVVDWEGGTRIGDSLDAFVRNWGSKGICRGGVVVICSDGLDRGDPQTLATAMDRLSRLCHRIVWMNPHKGDNPDYRAQTVGMMVAEPYVDELLSGHDLTSLEELAELLPHLG